MFRLVSSAIVGLGLLAGAAAAQAPALPGVLGASRPGFRPPPITENPTSVASGVYACLTPGPGGRNVPADRKININDELNYTFYTAGDREKLPGRYEFRERRLHWLSGPLAGGDAGEYEGDLHATPNQMAVRVLPPGGPQLVCYMSDEAG